MKSCLSCGKRKKLDQFANVYNRDGSVHKNGRNTCMACRATKRRESHLKTKYALSVAEFEALVAAQDFKCAICRKQFSDIKSRKRGECVDHCHQTGNIRGILCMNCNRGIGLLGDCKENLKRAVKYVSR